MSSQVINLEVTKDHAVPVEPQGGAATVLNVSGDTLYYADNPQVQASLNQGSLTAGQSQMFTYPVWIRSASVTAVTVTVWPASPPVNFVAANGVTDGTAINTAFVSSLYVKLTPGQTFVLDTPVIIPSGGTLDVSGATLVRAATFTTPALTGLGQGPYMITNRALWPLRSVTDAHITSGQATLTSATANFTAADVGRSVNLYAGINDTGEGDGAVSVLYTTIASVTNSTTAVLAENAGNTANGVLFNIYQYDTSVTLIGDANATINSGTSGFSTVRFRRITNTCNIQGRGMICTAGTVGQAPLGISVGDCPYVEINDIATLNTVIQTTGPIGVLNITNIHGFHGQDDMIAVTTSGLGWSSTTYDSNDTQGSVGDVYISNVYITQASSSHGVNFMGVKDGTGNALTFGDIVIEKVYGITTLAQIRISEEDGGFPTVGTLTIRDCNLQSNGGAGGQGLFPTEINVLIESAAMKHLLMENVTLTNSNGIVSWPAVGVWIYGVVSDITLKNVNVNNGGGTSYNELIRVGAAGGGFYRNISTVVDRLEISGTRLSQQNGRLLGFLQGSTLSTTCTQIVIRDVRASIGDGSAAQSLVQMVAGSPCSITDLLFEDVYLDSISGTYKSLVDTTGLSGAMKIRLNGVQLAGTGTNGLFFASTGTIELQLNNTSFNQSGTVVGGAPTTPKYYATPTVDWGGAGRGLSLSTYPT